LLAGDGKEVVMTKPLASGAATVACSMNTTTAPFLPPEKLETDLARVRTYWEGLKRGDATMPFLDDVNPSTIPDLSGRLMLIGVFDRPLRFRLDMVGQDIRERLGRDVVGKFLDEIDAPAPLQYLNSQASAAVESRAPTYYRHGSRQERGSRGADGYSRLVLPMWGDGRIAMLLGAITWS
jgi:PAS domain